MKTTVMEKMKSTAEKYSDQPALWHKVNGQWIATNWKNYYEQVKTIARAFMALGLEKGKAISILGNNCPQWVISDLAAIFAGGVPGGIYTTSSPEQCLFIARHSEANIVVVEDRLQLDKFKKIQDTLPDLKAIVMMTGSDEAQNVYAWDELPGIANSVSDEALKERIAAQEPDDCCTLVYTSGTTGNPKGVMITHDNILWTAGQVIESLNITNKEEFISYLPLSHIAEQMVSVGTPMISGCALWFAESLEKLGDNLREVRPTLFLGVPRVWEKIQAKMVAAGQQNSSLKKKIAAWARKKGLEAGYAEQKGLPKPGLYGLAEKLVFSKVHEKLGFDRCRVFVSTAAPISMDTLEFFLSLAIPITEIYGMSECTGPGTLSMRNPMKYRTGWAGPSVPGTETSIGEDGEVLMRGRHVFKGYFKNEEATKETIDKDGWLHSGDIGELDDEGFLKITDRKKELIITAGGENVPPQVIEGKLRAIPAISQAIVVGDRRKFISALFALDPGRIDIEAQAAGSTATDADTAATCEKFNAHIQKQVDAVNASIARAWGVKKFVILSKELAVETGELTATMKLKRRVILKNYKEQIESMYAN